jgi:hypothetical protein
MLDTTDTTLASPVNPSALVDSLAAAVDHHAVDLAVTLVLLAGSASLVAGTLGDPELMATVALAGVAVTLVALALLAVRIRGVRETLRGAAPTVTSA